MRSIELVETTNIVPVQGTLNQLVKEMKIVD
jgi:hypothetical protein